MAIGDVTVVCIAQTAAQAHDTFREFLLAQAPASFVDFVRVLVAEVAIAGDVVPVPVVMELLAMRHNMWRGACPQIEIEASRQRRGRVHQTNARPTLVTDRLSHFHIANFSTFDEVDRCSYARCAAALRPHLAHAAEFSGPLHDHSPFLNVVAAGLFHVDIFAGLHGPYSHQGVPVIWSGDRNDVDIFSIE